MIVIPILVEPEFEQDVNVFGQSVCSKPSKSRLKKIFFSLYSKLK